MAKDEILDVTDENDRVIGKGTRENVHNSRCWHRGIHVLVFNQRGDMLLPLRAKGRSQYPDAYDLSVSEHVLSGETYEQAARRGLLEELGIQDVGLEQLLYFRMNYGDPCDNSFSRLYKVTYDGDAAGLRIDTKEVASIRFLPPETVKEMLSRHPERFAYWTVQILNWFFGLPSKLVEI